MEGEDSEPEPTPADMRIGTQGIDLGSRDTSGEDDDEEPDSELEAFVAKSDEVIETLSSSLPASQDLSSQPPVQAPRGRGLQKRSAVRMNRQAIAIDDVDDDVGDNSEATVTDVATKAGRKRRIVEDSDSE